jgi:hypothetical protein
VDARAGKAQGELMHKAADHLDAANFEALMMYEQLRSVVRAIERNARRAHGPSQAAFMTNYPKVDPEGHAAWLSARNVLLTLEGHAKQMRIELIERGVPPEAFKGEWLEPVLEAGVWTLLERRAE